ncbi:putative uncharacterized protein MYH16 isoform X2 [Narcine bancroftii]|uniref:putative uncharacterized protein MYH16 isoform X2 n=1 Tax=Narcine bancroftii TaxID=1343680 RepID=UPI0038318667
MEKRVCVIQTDFHQYRPTISAQGKPLAHVKPLHVGVQNIEMRAKEKLKQAVEKADKLSLRVEELEQKNALLVQQKSASSEQKVQTLAGELIQRDETIATLLKEKQHLAKLGQHRLEDFHAGEDKVNCLSKSNCKLQAQRGECEHSSEQVKQLRTDLERGRRKLEGDLKMTIDSLNEMEKLKVDLEEVIKKKELEINTVSTKLEDEQSLTAALQRKIKEYQGRWMFVFLSQPTCA